MNNTTAPYTGRWVGGTPYTVYNDSVDFMNFDGTAPGTYTREKIEMVSITFDSDNGSEVPGVTLEKGTALTKPTDPTQTGYTFVGWYADKGHINMWVFGTPVTGDMTLYAKWAPVIPETVKVTVTFDSKGGTKVNSQTIEKNALLTEPTAPTQTGYTFAGWYTDDAFKNKWAFNTAVTDNMTLYAKWIKTTTGSGTNTNTTKGKSTGTDQLPKTGETVTYNVLFGSLILLSGLYIHSWKKEQDSLL